MHVFFLSFILFSFFLSFFSLSLFLSPASFILSSFHSPFSLPPPLVLIIYSLLKISSLGTYTHLTLVYFFFLSMRWCNYSVASDKHLSLSLSLSPSLVMPFTQHFYHSPRSPFHPALSYLFTSAKSNCFFFLKTPTHPLVPSLPLLSSVTWCHLFYFLTQCLLLHPHHLVQMHWTNKRLSHFASLLSSSSSSSSSSSWSPCLAQLLLEWVNSSSICHNILPPDKSKPASLSLSACLLLHH